MKTFYLFFLLYIFTLVCTNAQEVNKCPKVHDSASCVGFLGTYYVSEYASQANPSVIKIEIPQGVVVQNISGPPGAYKIAIESNKIIMTWIRGLDGDEVWPEIIINDGRHFYHIQVISVY